MHPNQSPSLSQINHLNIFLEIPRKMGKSIVVFFAIGLFLVAASSFGNGQPPPPPPPAPAPNCVQPPGTAMLIYNKSDPKIKTQVPPAAECQCPADPVNTIVFFNPVAQTPTTGDKAGASPINQQCDKPEDFCICDEQDVCWRLENAKAQVVINSFCDPECHMYARMNNIAPFTQTLVGSNGKKLTLNDQLFTLPNGKNHAYKEMKSSADYYVKAKSISCTGASGKCAPIQCSPMTTPAPPTPPMPPVTTPMPPMTPPQGVKPPMFLLILEIIAKFKLIVSGSINVNVSVDGAIDVTTLLSKPVTIDGQIVIVSDVQPNPTLLEMLSIKIQIYLPIQAKMILQMIPMCVKLTLQMVRVSDLSGFVSIMISGNVKSLKDLIEAMKVQAPGLYALIRALVMKITIMVKAIMPILDKLSDATKQFLKDVAMKAKDMAKEMCQFVKDKLAASPGVVPNLINVVMSLFMSIDIQIPLPPMLPPASTPAPPVTPPPMPFPFPISSLDELLAKLGITGNLAVTIKALIADVKAILQAGGPSQLLVTITASLNLNLDVDAQLQALAQKVQAECPMAAQALLSKLKPSDIAGLKVMINLAISGSLDLSKPADILAQLKAQAPGAFDLALTIMAKVQAYLQQFKDLPTDTDKIQQKVIELSVSLQATIKAQMDLPENQAALEKLKDMIKQLLPPSLLSIDVKVKLSAALNAAAQMLKDALKELSDPAKMQAAMDLSKVDPSNLAQLALMLKASLSVNIQVLLSMVKPSDLDGLKVVINMILQGQLTCIADILKALAEKAPGLVDALKLIIQLLMIIGKKLVEIAKNIYDKLDDSIKQMLKNLLNTIINFIKTDVKKAIEDLKDDIMKIIQKLLDDLQQAVPPLKSLIISIKIILNIQISVQISGDVGPPSPMPPPVTPPSILPLPPVPAACPAGGAVYGEWKTTGACTKDCGLCGTIKQERQCPTAPACPCNGPSSQDIPCNPKPCTFPADSCCTGKPAEFNKEKGTIECLPKK